MPDALDKEIEVNNARFKIEVNTEQLAIILDALTQYVEEHPHDDLNSALKDIDPIRIA